MDDPPRGHGGPTGQDVLSEDVASKASDVRGTLAAQPTPDSAVAAAHRGGPSTVVLIGVCWVLGAFGPVSRVAWHGHDGRLAAALIALGSLAMAAVLAEVRARPVLGWMATAAVGVACLATTVGMVGRAPALVAGLGVVTVGLCTGHALALRDRRTVTALPLVILAGFVWAASGSRLALLPLLLAGAIAVLRSRRPDVGDRFERRGREVIERVAVESAREPAALWVALIVALPFIPVFARLAADPQVVVRGVNDFEAHYERVAALRWSPWTLSVPHPGFHLLVKAAEVLVGSVAAMVAIEVAAVIASALILYLSGRGRCFGGASLKRWWASAFVVLALFAESPAVLVPAGDGWWARGTGFEQIGRGAGFLNLHIWGSPTISLAAPFYFALIPLGITLVRRNPSGLATRVAAAAVMAAACLTMPAAALALAPAAVVLVVLAGWPAGREDSAMATLRRSAWFVAPAVAVCVWQTWFLATSQSSLEEATWRLNPLWLVEYVRMDRPVFWSLLVIVLSAAVVGGRRFVEDPAVAWTGTATIIAAFPMLLLQETGWKATHGGMAVSFGVCAGLLVVYSIRFLLSDLQQAWADRADAGRPRVSLVVGAFVLLLCSVAGVLDHLAALGLLVER